MFSVLRFLSLSSISLFLPSCVTPPPISSERDPASLQAHSKVILVIIDGVRRLELEGKAKDDKGHSVAMENVFPSLSEMKKSGVFYSEMKISNPAGISLPAYSDIFAGRRQERIVTNSPIFSDFRSHYPTIFEIVKTELNLAPNGVGLFSSWEKLCQIATQERRSTKGEFFKSCGWQKGKYAKAEVFDESRADSDTFVEFIRELPKRHPILSVVHLGDADDEAHQEHDIETSSHVHYGIFHYHQALRADDYYVGRIRELIDTDPFYKGTTYLFVTTDHGRDNVPDPNQWCNHGSCRKHNNGELCSGCTASFLLAVGPGLKAHSIDRVVSHTDIAPTIAALLGVPMPSATGKPLEEIASAVIASTE